MRSVERVTASILGEVDRMFSVYSHDGLYIQYPENWQVTDVSHDSSPKSVTLQSPGTGFWSLQVLHVDESPDKLAGEVLQSMRSDYTDLEANLVRETISDVESIGYDMAFYCLDLLVNSAVRSFRLGDQVFVAMWQAEDREFQELSPVFLAITTSLIRQSIARA